MRRRHDVYRASTIVWPEEDERSAESERPLSLLRLAPDEAESAWAIGCVGYLTARARGKRGVTVLISDEAAYQALRAALIDAAVPLARIAK